MVSTVLVAFRVNATPTRAFEAFTEEIALWWRPHRLFQITPRGDGVLRFEPGPEGRLVAQLPDGKVHELGRITVWAPGERLVVGWRPASVPPDQATELEVRFEAIGAETRVTVEHRGWDGVARENAARHGFPDGPFLQHTARWWQGELAALARQIDDMP